MCLCVFNPFIDYVIFFQRLPKHVENIAISRPEPQHLTVVFWVWGVHDSNPGCHILYGEGCVYSLSALNSHSLGHFGPAGYWGLRAFDSSGDFPILGINCID